MRLLKLTLASLATLFMLCTPALAQGASDVQYVSGGFCPTGSDPGQQQTQSVCDMPPATANNVGQGTDAVNDALAGSSSTKSAATGDLASDASASSVPASGASASGSAPAGIASGDVAGDTATGSTGTGNPETGVAATGSIPAGVPEAAGVASEEGPASITELPETGGSPFATLISGVLLVTLGLMVRRIAP